MDRRGWLLGLAACALTTSVGVAQAPVDPHLPYDTKTEVTFTGIARKVSPHPEQAKTAIVVEVFVDVNGTEREVHLGPAQFLSLSAFPVEVGQTVTITGSATSEKGRPIVVARLIARGGKTLHLRDEKGVPLWKGTGNTRR